MSDLLWNDLDACSAVRKSDNSHYTAFMHTRLRLLCFCKAVADGYMAVALTVDTLHLTAEEPAVCRGVRPLVVSNVIVDHLMQNRVVHYLLRQINTHIDAQYEIRVLIPGEQPLSLADKAYFS